MTDCYELEASQKYIVRPPSQKTKTSRLMRSAQRVRSWKGKEKKAGGTGLGLGLAYFLTVVTRPYDQGSLQTNEFIKGLQFWRLRVHDHHRGGSMAVGRRDIPAAAESSLLDS